MKPTTPRLLLVAALAMPLAAQAQQIISLSIGMNHSSNPGNVMLSSDYAGAKLGPTEDYRVNTWNTLGKNSAGTATFSGTNMTYNDGSTVGGSFQVSISNTSVSQNLPASTTLTNDTKFYRGYIELQNDATASLSLSGISFTNYKIIVYTDGGHVNRGGSVTLAANGSQAAETFYVRGNRITAEDGTGYSLATSTTYESGTSSSVVASNYVVFDGLSASSQTIDFATILLGDANRRLNIVGIQIVEVIPEPASAAMLAGLACLGGAALRRRRRAV